ncbi:MAG: UDP-N-acetylmuramoyl-L-alanyl-D-glutamate--2,6-diaminopimelate ligase [Acidimicrobiia bacterium]
MRLHDLLDATDVLELFNDAPVVVIDVHHDSRSVAPGSLFGCVVGAHADGHRFAGDAVERGAVALLVERPVPFVVPQARVASVRRALGPVSARVHGDPSRRMPVVGITGTNGKTTTAALLEGIAEAVGLRPAVIGTLGVTFEGATADNPFTTPEASDLQRTLAALSTSGAGFVVMEVSSHALAEHRVDGTTFAAVVLTNVTHEHLDYHGTFEAYFAAKARLFEPEFSSRAVLNLDDARGRELARRVRATGVDVISYGIDAPDADVRATDLVADAGGTRFRLMLRDAVQDVALGLPGRFNVANALAAAATGLALDIDGAAIAAGLAEVRSVPGRFEPVGPGTPIAVIVDYAHTPDGITTALGAARAVTPGRVIAVFGCGGDRDAIKRPLMGVAAGRGADVVVLTSDNPRSEDPEVIADAAAAGLHEAGVSFVRELDRRTAIRLAIESAQPGDTVMLLGKGAETTQQLADRTVDFDDRVVAAELLESVCN